MARNEEQRPVHRNVDVLTGEVTETPISDEDWDAMDSREAADAERRAAQQAEDEALRAAVAAHADPVVQALARRAGLT